MDNKIIIEELLKIFKDFKKVNVLKLKKINKNLYDEIMSKTNYITNNKKFTQRVYHIFNDLDSIPKCKICEKNTTFIDISKGYSIYCSRICCNTDPAIIKKVTETNRKTYDENKKVIIEKIKKTCLDKYGVEDPNILNEIKNKIKNTKIKNNINEQKCLKKRRETCLKKYGTEDYVKSVDFKEKLKNTIENKYGGIHPLKTESIKQKIKETVMNKYGVDNIFKYEPIMSKNIIDSKEKFHEILKKELQLLKFELLDENYIDNKTEHNWKCLKCNKTFKKIWRDMCRGYTCPHCYPRINTSKSEKEIEEFLNSYNINIETHNRKILWPKELDIYIPSNRIAIEFNGLYWHNDERLKDPLYHLNKTDLCIQNNIRLIHIFEDEWLFKNDIVQRRIMNILGVRTSNRIHARKCIIKEIISQEKDDFLNKYHIQGKDVSSIRLGAFFQDKLIAVMTFSKGNISKGSHSEEDVWELNRFCSDYNFHIPGIASKLLKHFQRNYEWKQIFSYADRRWSTGNLYYKLGFSLDHITKPNYWYIKGSQRIHRFNLRKRPDEPKDIPEWVLRQTEGYHKIWDCGNLKFVLKG